MKADASKQPTWSHEGLAICVSGYHSQMFFWGVLILKYQIALTVYCFKSVVLVLNRREANSCSLQSQLKNRADNYQSYR